MSSSGSDREAAEAERKSTLAEILKEGVAETAVQLTANVVVETVQTVISGAADVAANAGEMGIADQL